MKTRTLGYFEELGHRYDRAHTLNFTTFAELDAALTEGDVRAALDRLILRHPSLAMSVDGTQATQIPLSVHDGGPEAWRDVAADELRDGHWSAERAPARAHLVSHAGGGSTLAITLWHAISDGKSGIFAMRDLLTLLEDESQVLPPRAPSRLEDHLGPGFRRGTLKKFSRRQREAASVGAFQTWKDAAAGPPASRRQRIAALEIDTELVRDLRRRAATEGCTLHSVLTAAMARSILILGDLPNDAPLLSFHPVDMRAYLARQGRADVGDSIGYHISFVDLALRLPGGADPWDDVVAVHTLLHGAIDGGVPEFTATAGAWATRALQRTLGVSLSRRLLEGPLAGAAFALSNLGRLESLGVRRDAFRRLGLRDVHFVGAPSLTANVCGSAVGFGDAIRMNVATSSPSLSDDAGERLTRQLRASLERLRVERP